MYIDINIEFGGFYGYHEEYIDGRVEMYAMDDETDMEEAIEKVDYKKTFDNYAEAWLYRLENAIHNEPDLDVELIYEGLDSPKYYNYRTDKIVAKIPTLHAKRLIDKFADQPKFREFAEPQYTSRDGYWSKYDGVEDVIEQAILYGEPTIAFAHLTETILEYIATELEINENIYDLEYEISYN